MKRHFYDIMGLEFTQGAKYATELINSLLESKIEMEQMQKIVNEMYNEANEYFKKLTKEQLAKYEK